MPLWGPWMVSVVVPVTTPGGPARIPAGHLEGPSRLLEGRCRLIGWLVVSK